jgi:hypothetical protein
MTYEKQIMEISMDTNYKEKVVIWQGNEFRFGTLMKITGMSKVGLERALKSKQNGIDFKGKHITSANCFVLTGVSWQTFKSRYDEGLPVECLGTPVNKTGLRKRSKACDDLEAWKDLTPEQLETMRDFDLIGRASKYT